MKKLPLFLALTLGVLLFLSPFLLPEQKEVYRSATTTPTVISNKYYKPLVVNVLASANAFTPKLIRAHLGQEVNVRILSRGDHSFIIDAFKINQETPDNKTTIVTFIPDKIGTFRFYSKVGQDLANNMAGHIIVVE